MLALCACPTDAQRTYFFMLFCRNCESEQHYHTEQKGVHLTAFCNTCGGYIKNIPHQPPTFYVGKYKGKLISEIDDLSYLKWAYENMTALSSYIKSAIKDRIYSLENMLK